MRNLEEIENELATARKEAEHVTGTPAEVYSRIVGYYRSVRNWNKGKREEYGERVMFDVEGADTACADTACAVSAAVEDVAVLEEAVSSGDGLFSMLPARNVQTEAAHDARLMLFVRPHCPACPSARAAAGKLGIPVDEVNADTDTGMNTAEKMQVFSTPTAILLAPDGRELRRARDAGAIATLLEAVA